MANINLYTNIYTYTIFNSHIYVSNLELTYFYIQILLHIYLNTYAYICMFITLFAQNNVAIEAYGIKPNIK